jgi:hypothetical protein
MDKFLDAYGLQNLKQQAVNILHRSIKSNDIEEGVYSLPTKKSTGPDGFTA